METTPWVCDAHVCTHSTHVCMWMPEVDTECLVAYLILFLKQSLSLNAELTSWLGCLTSDSKGPSCLQLPYVGITGTCCYTWLLIHVLDLNSGPHASVVSVLSTEPPRPCLLSLKAQCPFQMVFSVVLSFEPYNWMS